MHTGPFRTRLRSCGPSGLNQTLLPCNVMMRGCVKWLNWTTRTSNNQVNGNGNDDGFSRWLLLENWAFLVGCWLLIRRRRHRRGNLPTQTGCTPLNKGRSNEVVLPVKCGYPLTLRED